MCLSADFCGRLRRLAGASLQGRTYRSNHPCEEKSVSLVLGQLKGVGERRPAGPSPPATSLRRPPARRGGQSNPDAHCRTRPLWGRSLYAVGVGGAESNHQRAVFQPHVVLRPALLRQRPLEPALRRTAFFFAFSLVFAFAARRRMAPRFYPTPNEMNVKRSLKPTAEKTENRRKT